MSAGISSLVKLNTQVVVLGASPITSVDCPIKFIIAQHAYRPHHGGYHPQQGGYHPQQSGYHAQQSGYHPQQGGYHQPGGYNSQQFGSYNHQGGYVNSKSSGKGTFGKAILGGVLGGAAGLATFQLGKASYLQIISFAILHSNSNPLRAPNGQDYYFDKENHILKNGYFMCSVPIDDVVKMIQEGSTPAPNASESKNSTSMTPEEFFKTVQFKDGSRPKSITWNCKSGTEVCCGTDCCPAPKAPSGTSPQHSRPSWIIYLRDVNTMTILREQSNEEMKEEEVRTDAEQSSLESERYVQNMNSQRRLPLELLLLLVVIGECGCKRGGTLTGGRGTSASRSGGLFGGLRTSGGLSGSGARTGIFGSSKSAPGYPRDSKWGTRRDGRFGGTAAGQWGSSSRSTSWGRPRGGGLFTKSNIGSFIAGAAAGYLTYKAGKALIRSAYAPMMWNSRPYYWGSNYYRSGYGTHMCRMPVQEGDPQLGNVYFDDGTRPKELVWSCNYDEYCCGYDCCWRGGASSFPSFGFGNILLIVPVAHFI
uniref:CX domain-containing protein n=1 Tax=Setaria digitata TaxID=48799 RepID=A0A915PZN7_9BILA